jgi:hypothetical protein
MTGAFPLQWPHGQPRTKSRADSAFRVTHSVAYDKMMDELDRFGARSVVVSTNISLRRDGTPYRDGLTEVMDDPGVAVYFTRGKVQIALAVDCYRRPWENCHAIGKAIEAFRSLERSGAQQIMNQAFTGFMALPAPDAKEGWWSVLGVDRSASAEAIQAAYKAKARANHGDSAAMVRINTARDEAVAERAV